MNSRTLFSGINQTEKKKMNSIQPCFHVDPNRSNTEMENRNNSSLHSLCGERNGKMLAKGYTCSLLKEKSSVELRNSFAYSRPNNILLEVAKTSQVLPPQKRKVTCVR